MRTCIPWLVVLAATAGPALGEGQKAAFIKGIYAMEGRCAAWAAIEAGGERNVESVPETLSEDGFQSWEGNCTFSAIEEKVMGRRWVAEMNCHDAAEEYEEEDTFDLDPDTGRITVMVDDKISIFERCDAPKGN